MREALIKKLSELGEEASSLVDRREQAISAIQDIEIRLHQISGAISELDKLLKNEKENEAS
jgi:uncharacterized coiled-coil DUF342 family protein